MRSLLYRMIEKYYIKSISQYLKNRNILIPNTFIKIGYLSNR